MTTAHNPSLQTTIDALSLPGIMIGHRAISICDEHALMPEEAAAFASSVVMIRRASDAVRIFAPQLFGPSRAYWMRIAESYLGSANLADWRCRLSEPRFARRGRSSREASRLQCTGNQHRACRTIAIRAVGLGGNAARTSGNR